MLRTVAIIGLLLATTPALADYPPAKSLYSPGLLAIKLRMTLALHWQYGSACPHGEVGRVGYTPAEKDAAVAVLVAAATAEGRTFEDVLRADGCM